ncbi:MAG: cytochrome c [Deltaproteobacteria bacterium]|nr:cytochrome c [Deltaproteobacteria bacterium]MBW2499533.1 cytochrome c [Deltaproteobacteria bacterium]
MSPPPASSANQAAEQVDGRSQEDLIAAGRSVYNANCIACHAMDPSRDGALGPAVAGSSYELLEARIVRGVYPEGYTPKRESRVMVALPHLESRLGELAAYLGSL